MKPLLTGTRILDLTTVVLGPYATQLLADLGAEVIKVEPPEGEICRHVGHARSRAMAPLYLNLNRNKKSVVLDLKQEKDRTALLELTDSADVFVHNMRPSAVTRLGVGYEALAARNRRLVYCAAWGFRADGPYGDLPAYDDVVQAASGLAALNQVDGVPRYMPTILADKVTGMFVANSILAALMHRDRTGQGQFIEVPMLECLVSFLMTEHLAGATYEPPLTAPGYERVLGSGRRLYKTKDGYIAILPYMTDHWVRFLTHVGRRDLAESPTVLDPQKRSHAIDMLYGVIAAATPAKTRSQWFQELKALEIPCMPVNGIDELFDNEHLRAVGTFRTVDHPTEGRLKSVEFPVRFSGVDDAPDRPAPSLGQDTRDVLGRDR
jgi:crotonobetainyl-CoA:carnitine CoA-transferase CaiB-like acyl-CoA transferase